MKKKPTLKSYALKFYDTFKACMLELIGIQQYQQRM